MGDLAESGREAKAYLDLSNEFVLLEVGKRGSGKSYSMGALLEGLATKGEEDIHFHVKRIQRSTYYSIPSTSTGPPFPRFEKTVPPR